MQELRTTTDLIEIATTLKQISEMAKPVLIWQTDQTTHDRTVVHAKISKINFDDLSVLIKSTNSNEVFSFNNDVTLYFHSEHRSLIFKLGQTMITKNMLLIKIPKEAKLLELRKSDRETFSKNKPKITYQKFRGYGTETLDFKSELLDISEKGMAFVLSNINRHHFSEGDKITLISIGSTPLESPRMGSILYIVPMNLEEAVSTRVYRVGVQFID